jgi:hypothetical protein
MRCVRFIPLLGLTVLAATAPAQSYRLAVPEGRRCPSGQCSSGTLTADLHDQVEVVVGTAFDINQVADRRVYRNSRIAIDGGKVALYNRVQVAGFPRWRITRDTWARSGPSLAAAGVKLKDILTITGATGKGYFLPVYRVYGRLSRPPYAYLRAFLFIDAHISGRPHFARRGMHEVDARRGSQTYDMDELYRFEPTSALEFEFGVPFVYQVDYFTHIVPPGEYDSTATLLDFAGRDDVMMDSLHIELRGVLITDTKSEPVSGATISSQSGIQYPVQILPGGKRKRR